MQQVCQEMSRKIPNQKKKYKELEKRINKYTLELEHIFDILNAEAARLALSTSYDNSLDELFSFSKYPETRYGIQRLQEKYVNDIGSLIYSSTSEEWKNSNLACDLVADGVLKSYIGQVNREIHKQYYQTNSAVLKAFQQRKDRGLSLSNKLWKQSDYYKNSLESTISLALERGTSAITLSKQISKYLKDFSTFQKDYKERFGQVANIYDCEYRAARLARTEINMAYRTAEQTRWGQMDFVIGYEVKLSDNHNCKGIPRGQFFDICDELAGKYPKDFEFRGWHCNCRCYTIPILKTDEEYLLDLPGKNEVKDVPEQFKQWMRDNKERYERAKERGTLPYFVRDNKKIIDGINEVSKKYYISAEDVNLLQVNGFEFKGFGENIVGKYKESPLRGFNLVKFDSFVENICDEWKLKIEKKSVVLTRDNDVSFSYTAYGENGDFFSLVRRFIMQDGKRVVIHSNFVLPEKMQGQGISKSLFRELFKQYESMGVNEVQLYANMDVGGYAWGKYGFCGDKEDVLDILKDAYEERHVINKNRYNELIIAVNKKGEKIPMNIIANEDDGKKILLGQSWIGKFDMSDKKQLEYLKDYVGL